jgi:hypothetical protein
LTLPLLILLAVIWVAVLSLPTLRARSVRSRDSIGEFNFRLGTLGQTNRAVPAVARAGGVRVGGAAKRRRDVLRVLAGSVAVTGMLALVTNAAAAWALNMVADIAFAVFLGLWAWARSVQADRAAKVRALSPRRHPAQLPLRRAASS